MRSHTDMPASANICIIAPKYLHPGVDELIVPHRGLDLNIFPTIKLLIDLKLQSFFNRTIYSLFSYFFVNFDLFTKRVVKSCIS